VEDDDPVGVTARGQRQDEGAGSEDGGERGDAER
jgi:hypothetical protein